MPAGLLQDPYAMMTRGGSAMQQQEMARIQQQRLADAARLTLETIGPQADVNDLVQFSGDASKRWGEGDYLGAVGNAGLAAAAVPMMAMPFSVGGITRGVKKGENALAELFQGQAPDRSEFTLLRPSPTGKKWKTPPETSALIQRVLNDKRVSRQFDALIRGGEDIGRKWYDTEKLRNAFIKELGEEQGDQAWRNYIWLVGATSTGSKVPQNLKNASYWFQQDGHNNYLRSIADDLDAPGTKAGAAVRQAYRPDEGYGHRYWHNHLKNVGKYVSDNWHPENASQELNMKVRGFAQSLLGNTRNIAEDIHFMRLMGMMSNDPRFLNNSAKLSKARADALLKAYPKFKKHMSKKMVKSENGKLTPEYTFKTANAFKTLKKPEDQAKLMRRLRKTPYYWREMPKPGEYGPLEEMMAELAKRYNMTPAQMQASLWMGAARRTNVDPGSLKSFEDLFDDVVAKGAAERGITPEEHLKNFIHRRSPLAIPGLLGAGGAAAGAGLLGGQEEVY